MSKIKILISVYNDWQSVLKLLENINLEVLTLDVEISVMIINDASTEQRPVFSVKLDNLKSLQIINMQENRGHARCNAAGLKYINDKETKLKLLCELNVIEQVANICNTTILKKAWQGKQNITVHGFIYNLHDGILKDLNVSFDAESK